MIKLDLIGQRFGRLVVLEKLGSRNQKVYWGCKCDCGHMTQACSGELRYGRVKSCGCLGVEARTAATVKSNTTHGRSRTPTYEAWFNMKRRCQSKSHKSYPEYGGRGISVCPAWQNFEAFFADMGECPVGLTLDRIDTNGDYEPGNCRWATPKTQQNNRRNNRRITAFGLTRNLQQWAEENGITADAISKRLEAGWPAARAVSQPMKADKRRAANA